MSTLLLIYAVVITLELILSLVMAVILFLIIAPPGASRHPTERTPETGSQRQQLSPTVNGAVRDAFSSLSRGDNDMSTIVHARHMLAQYAEHHRTDSAPAAE